MPEDRVLEYAARVMGLDRCCVNMGTKREELPQWDSLNHIRLVAELEENFGVEIPIEDLADINTLGDFLKYFTR